MDRVTFEFQRFTTALEDRVKSLVYHMVKNEMANLLNEVNKAVLAEPIVKHRKEEPKVVVRVVPRSRRTVDTVKLEDKIYEAVKRHPKGVSVGQLVEEIKITRKSILYHLVKMREDKRIHMTGKRRQSLYFAN